MFTNWEIMEMTEKEIEKINMAMGYVLRDKNVSNADLYHEMLAFKSLYTRWNENLRNAKFIGEYLFKKNKNNIAIYGFGEVGIQLCQELLLTKSIKVKFFIDREKKYYDYKKIESVLMDDVEVLSEMNIDLIIVTVVGQFLEIKNDLKSRTKADILSIEDVVFDM